jgi:hypothetical protein
MGSNEKETSTCPWFLPNKLGRFYLLALEDVMGGTALNAVLNQAKLRYLINNYPPDNLDLGWSFEETGALNQALDDIHGAQTGRGLAVRAGRASLYYFLDDLGAVLGITDVAFRVLPLGTRIKSGLHAIADTFNKTSDQVVRVEEEPDRFLVRVERCPICWGRSADAPICHAHLGLLQEGMHWATHGRSLRVAEILCIAKGDASCTYAVDKKPLE